MKLVRQNALSVTLLSLLAVFGFGSSAVQASQFGYAGQDGDYGRDGYDGRNGSSATVVADGGNYRYDLRGDDGYPGQDGRDGRGATDCQQPRNVPYNLYGAEGGSGGRAGTGGTGGSGGDVVVYFEDIANLRTVSIDALGGRGGEAGRSGRGSYGCHCTSYRWQVDGATYSCSDGRDGNSGNYGRPGPTGSTGTAKLISQLTPLPQEQPNRLVKLSTLVNSDQQISRHLWTQRDGASSLFAPGSRLASRYSLFQGTQTVTYALDWKANRAVDEFSETGVQMYFGQSGPTVGISDDVWMVHQLEGTSPSVKLVISDAIKVSEVLNLKIEKFTGRGRDLTMVLQDNAPEDNVVTTFGVTYHTRGLAFWRVRYDGGVDQSLVTKADGKILVNIGRLNIHSDFLQAGTQFLLQVRAKRSFGGRYMILNYERESQIQ